MARNQTYKAFSTRPTHVMDLSGELLDSAPLMDELAAEVRGISAYATFIARNDTELEAGLARATAVQAATAGRQAGITMPEFLAADKKDENGEPVKDEHGEPVKSKTGRSRKEWLVRHNAVTAFRSWQERVKAVNGESPKYVSQGWKHTTVRNSLVSNNHDEPRVYINGKPCNFSQFSVSDNFLDAWLAEESANNSDNDANSANKSLKPGDYIPGEVREAFAERLGLGNLEDTQ